LLLAPCLGEISSQKFHVRDPVDQAILGVGGEFLGEIRGHFRRCQDTQTIEVFLAKSGLDRREPLFEDAKVRRSDFEFRGGLRAPRTAAKTGETTRRAHAALP
jgi:hypothetical protein